MSYQLIKNKLGGILISHVNEIYKEKRAALIEKHNERFNLKGRLTASDVKESVYSTDQLLFEITEECNLKCVYCAYCKYYRFANANRRNTMTWGTIETTLKYVLNNRRNNSALNIGFYGGEPLLEFQLIMKTVEFCNNYDLKNIYFTFGLTTNGILVNKHIDFLVKNNFNILVSLDGDKFANSFRVFKNNKESFSTIFSNLKKIKLKYPDFFKYNLNFASVLHQKNSIEGILSFFQNSFNKTPLLNSVSETNINPKHKDEFYLKIYKNHFENITLNCNGQDILPNDISFNPFTNSLISLIKNFSSFIYNNYSDLVLNNDNDNDNDNSFIPTATCLPFSKRMFITANGDILPCERINYKHSLGKIINNVVKIDFSKIANYYNQFYNTLEPQCMKCGISDNCEICMFDADLNKCISYKTIKKAEQDYNYLLHYCELNPVFLKQILYETSIE
jgi:uncharacterized protein